MGYFSSFVINSGMNPGDRMREWDTQFCNSVTSILSRENLQSSEECAEAGKQSPILSCSRSFRFPFLLRPGIILNSTEFTARCLRKSPLPQAVPGQFGIRGGNRNSTTIGD